MGMRPCPRSIEFFAKIAFRPRYRRYAAPRYFTMVKSVAEAAITAEMPTTAMIV